MNIYSTYALYTFDIRIAVHVCMYICSCIYVEWRFTVPLRNYNHSNRTRYLTYIMVDLFNNIPPNSPYKSFGRFTLPNCAWLLYGLQVLCRVQPALYTIIRYCKRREHSQVKHAVTHHNKVGLERNVQFCILLEAT